MASLMKRCGNVAFCLVVFLLVIVLEVPVCHAVDSVEASEAITQAEMAWGPAYALVVEAEGVGANVSELLSRLDATLGLLSRAYSEFGSGDYDNASVLAFECRLAVEGVAGDAAALKADLERARNDKLIFSAAWSGVGLVLVFVFGFLGWRSLKRWYFRMVLKKKPQVEVI